MPLITINNCPICGSSETSKAFDAVDYFSTKETFPVCDCRSCGFRFTNNFPSDDIIGRYYDSPDYISHSDSKKGFTNFLYHFFRKRMLKKKVNLVSKYVSESQNMCGNIAQQHTRLLDIGCATGYFLNTAKKKGYTVSGIEKNIKARDYAISNFGLDVKDEQSLWNIENESFDVITLWHVLEHMQKLNEVIDKLKSILAPNGTLVLALPNYQSYDAKIYEEFWAAYDIPRHLWHFSHDTIENLLSKYQFKIIKRIAMPLDAYYISMLSEKYKGSSKLAQYFRAILAGTIGFMRSLKDIKNSSSVIYIAKK